MRTGELCSECWRGGRAFDFFVNSFIFCSTNQCQRSGLRWVWITYFQNSLETLIRYYVRNWTLGLASIEVQTSVQLGFWNCHEHLVEILARLANTFESLACRDLGSTALSFVPNLPMLVDLPERKGLC